MVARVAVRQVGSRNRVAARLASANLFQNWHTSLVRSIQMSVFRSKGSGGWT